ncbi:MAG: hypothetical protein MJB14_18305, partial [Spirochaetes bacterium]|nr:hypothetical protein [Spirochaetota bacterium]
KKIKFHLPRAEMILIGHRGAAGSFPENTASAFKYAVDLGLAMIELDVQITADEEVVIHHDFNTLRTTGIDYNIYETKLTKLKRLNYANYLKSYDKEESILTLGELFQLVPQSLMINVEIKNISRKKTNITRQVLDIVHHYSREESVLISAFDHNILLEAEKINPQLKLGLLLYSNLINPVKYIQTLDMSFTSIHPAIELIDERTIKDLKKEGYQIYIYTVNSREEYQFALEAQADGVITDFPERFKI